MDSEGIDLQPEALVRADTLAGRRQSAKLNGHARSSFPHAMQERFIADIHWPE
jgi:hypothetical protein